MQQRARACTRFSKHSASERLPRSMLDAPESGDSAAICDSMRLPARPGEMEAAPGLEPGNNGFAIRLVTLRKGTGRPFLRLFTRSVSGRVSSSVQVDARGSELVNTTNSPLGRLCARVLRSESRLRSLLPPHPNAYLSPPRQSLEW